MKHIIRKFWIQLKNNSISEKSCFKIKNSTKLLPLVQILYSEGYIKSFFKTKNNEFLIIYINKSFLNSLKLWGITSKKKSLTYKQISALSTKNKFYIISTSKGYKNIQDCKKLKIGGRLYISI